MTTKTKIEKQTLSKGSPSSESDPCEERNTEPQLTTLILMTSTASLVLHPREENITKQFSKLPARWIFKVTQCVGISSFVRLAFTQVHKASPLISDFSKACRNLERFYLLFLLCFTGFHLQASCRHFFR